MADEQQIEIPIDFSPYDIDKTVFYGITSRSIPISGVITEDVSLAVVSQIQELASISDEPIRLVINTGGGSLVDAFAIYDMCRIVRCPIVTVVNGLCASAGLVLCAAGDLRLATPLSIFFYHQPETSIGSITLAQEFVDHAKSFVHVQTKMTDILRSTMKMNKTQFKKEFGPISSKHFTAEEAVDYGLINSLMKYSKKEKGVFEEISGQSFSV